MQFRSELLISEFPITPDSATLAFVSSYPTTVRFRRATDAESKSLPRPAVCEVSQSREVPRRPNAWFSAVAARRLPDDYVRQELAVYSGLFGENHVLQEGKRFPADILPNAFLQFCEEVDSSILREARRALRLLHWRLGAPMPYGDARIIRRQFSLDGETWHERPFEFVLPRMRAYVLPVLQPEPLDDISAMASDGVEEPLGHDLHREATRLIGQSPRSALLLALAAAEVGFKQWIGVMVPKAEWLAMNVPTPPLDTMLREYTPLLLANCGIVVERPPAIPSAIMQMIKRGITWRNHTIHRGQSAPDEPQLRDLLAAVKDLLWLLDFYAGYSWAFAHMSERIQAELRAPD